MPPGVAADVTGAPHLVYTWMNTSTGVRELVHDAWNGTTWDAEALASGTDVPDNGSYSRFAVAPSGALHVAFFGPRTVDSAPVVHLVRENGVTTWTTIDPEPVTSFATLSIAMQAGDDGTVVLAREGYVYTADGSAIVLSTRTPDGSWSLDPVPIGSMAVNGFSLAVGHAGDVAVAYARIPPGGGEEEVRVIRRAGGVWSAPELVLTRPWGGGSDVETVAASPDLSRIALLVSRSGTSWIAMRGSSGWEVVQVGPSVPAGEWLGFGTSGFWAVYRNDLSSTPTIRYSAFADAPP